MYLGMHLYVLACINSGEVLLDFCGCMLMYVKYILVNKNFTLSCSNISLIIKNVFPLLFGLVKSVS